MVSLPVFGQSDFAKSDPTPLSPTDIESVKVVVHGFFDAFKGKDLKVINAFWSPKSPTFENYLSDIKKIFEFSGPISADVKSFGQIEMIDGKVVIPVNVEFRGEVTVKNGKTPIYASSNRYIRLIKEESVWKIFSHGSEEAELATRLINEKNPDARDIILAENLRLVNPALVDVFTYRGNTVYGNSPWKDVLDIFRLGLKVAERTGNKVKIAEALNNIGTAFEDSGDRTNALASYERGHKLAEEAGDKQLIVRVAVNKSGFMTDPVSNLQNALLIAKEIGFIEAVQSINTKLGIHYSITGNYIEAERFFLESLRLARESGDVQGISGAMGNIGILSDQLGKFDEAIGYFNEAIRLDDSSGNKGNLVMSLYNLGNVYKEIGDLANAMTFYQRSLDVARELDPNDDNGPVLFNIGSLYLQQGSYSLAESMFSRALVYFERTGSTYGIGLSLSGLADVYQKQGNHRKAIEFVEKSYFLQQKDVRKENMISDLIKLGVNYREIGDTGKAIDCLAQALKLAEAAKSNLLIRNVKIETAKLALAMSDLKGSLENAEAGLAAMGSVVGANEWELFSILGQAQYGLGRFDEAQVNLSRAISMIERQRSQIAGDTSESQKFLSRRTLPYQLMVQLRIGAGQLAEGLFSAEALKSRTLVDSIQSGQSDLMEVISETDRRKESGLRAELVSLNARASIAAKNGQDNKVSIVAIDKMLNGKRLEFEDFQNKLFVKYPQLRTRRGAMMLISVEDTAALVPNEKTVIIEYVVACEKAFLFVISKDAFKKVSLKVFTVAIKDKEFAKKIENYRSKLASGDLEFQNTSRELYDLLLKPAEAQLAGKTNLIIVPDGPLWDLPFQALINDRGQYLVEQAAVSYAPSLTALKELSKKAKSRMPNAGMELLAFGNPTVGKSTAERVQRVFMSEKLEPIPEAERLVNSLAKMYGPTRSKVYTGADAREEVAKTESPKYRIVQFATHGILNNVSPMYSHLVLAQNEKNPNEDGLLEAWELKDLDLKADMVILSACDTARGKISGGEGVIGMTWASFIAGAPTTVASQWKVESKSTTELMLEFHRQLLTGKGISKSEALRRASLKLMKMPQYKHPSYWAGFVMIGDGS